jgi:hypothetical protein
MGAPLKAGARISRRFCFARNAVAGGPTAHGDDPASSDSLSPTRSDGDPARWLLPDHSDSHMVVRVSSSPVDDPCDAWEDYRLCPVESAAAVLELGADGVSGARVAQLLGELLADVLANLWGGGDDLVDDLLAAVERGDDVSKSGLAR